MLLSACPSKETTHCRTLIPWFYQPSNTAFEKLSLVGYFVASIRTQRAVLIFIVLAQCVKFLGNSFRLNTLAQINTIYIYATEKRNIEAL